MTKTATKPAKAAARPAAKKAAARPARPEPKKAAGSTLARKAAAKKGATPLLDKALNATSMSTTTADLLTKPGAWQPGETSALQHLPIAQVFPAADNPRSNLGDLGGLAASITAVGILEPILVRVSPFVGGKPKYQIVAGHRRHAAAKIAGLELIPCLVREFTEQARVEAMVIENLQRSDLSPFDEARGLTQLVGVGLTQRDIAERVGCSQSHVSKRLALADMPTDAELLFVEGKVTIAHVEELAKVPDDLKGDVLKKLVKLASGKTSLLPDWEIKNQIANLKRLRKHKEAAKEGNASGLTRLTGYQYLSAHHGAHRTCKKTEATHWYLDDRDDKVTWARTEAAHNKANPAKAEPPQPPSSWQLRDEAAKRIDAFIGDTIVPKVTHDVAARGAFVTYITSVARRILDTGAGDWVQLYGIEAEFAELVGVDDALYMALAMVGGLANAKWDLPILELFIDYGYRTTGTGETFPDGFDTSRVLITDPVEPVPEPAAS